MFDPALVNATRKIGPLYLHHLHTTGVLHVVATLRRLYALWAVLEQLDIRNVAMKILNSLRHVISGY
jgi:hypothetical protein